MTASLGDRIKLYERAHDVHFTPNSPVIVRVDGKAFHTYLRGAERPFDGRFMDAMVVAARMTSAEMQGFKLAYTQSDECTFLVTDYDSHETQGWFDYSLNKIVSVTASMFTAYFNDVHEAEAPGIFDARAFIVPVADAPNVFVWRQRDWERNSLQMLARSVFSHRECYGKKAADLHEMLHERGINWADLGMRLKNGTFITRDGSTLYDKLAYADVEALLNPEIHVREEDEPVRRDSPFGMDECCICDGPATHAGETEKGERLPYCKAHLDEVVAQFPETPVSLLRTVAALDA